MSARATGMVLAVAVCMPLAGCGSSYADDGVTQLCREAAVRQPDSNMDPGKDCACASEKLQDFLTDDHYELLEGYSTLLVDIAIKNPDLRGREGYDRTLAALAEQRGESVSEVSNALSAGGPLRFVRLAEQICRDR